MEVARPHSEHQGWISHPLFINCVLVRIVMQCLSWKLCYSEFFVECTSRLFAWNKCDAVELLADAIFFLWDVTGGLCKHHIDTWTLTSLCCCVVPPRVWLISLLRDTPSFLSHLPLHFQTITGGTSASGLCCAVIFAAWPSLCLFLYPLEDIKKGTSMNNLHQARIFNWVNRHKVQNADNRRRLHELTGRCKRRHGGTADVGAGLHNDFMQVFYDCVYLSEQLFSLFHSLLSSSRIEFTYFVSNYYWLGTSSFGTNNWILLLQGSCASSYLRNVKQLKSCNRIQPLNSQ